MLAQALALVLAVDAGMPDAGFQPVVLDVHHGELWLTRADGGASDAPAKVHGGIWMDDDTTVWLGQKKAWSRGVESVGPEVDTKTLTLVGAVLFAIGVFAGGIAVAAVLWGLGVLRW
jgi:hypothetical protein